MTPQSRNGNLQNSLRRRLTRSFIGLSLVPLLLVGLILTTLAYVVEARQAHTQEALVAQRVSQEVQSFLTEVEGELQLLIYFDLIDLPPDEQESLLLNLLFYHDHFDELILLNDVGEIQAQVTRLTVINPNEPPNYAAADEFLIPSRTQETYFSPISFAANTGEPLLILGIPIINPRTGQISGVLVAHTRMKQVWELIAAIPLRSGESVYIVDSHGQVVAHRNPSTVLRGTRVDLPAHDGLARGLDSSWAILVEQLLDLPGQNLTVVAERGVIDALTLPILTGTITAGLFFVTWLVATVRGVRTVNHIVQPIQDLLETTHAIRAGNLTRRASVTQQDEVGELAAAFNDMADQLRHTMGGLQEKIIELEQASHALQESETRYRSIFENAQEGIYRASPQGRFLMVNPALVHILGYNTDAELLTLDLTHDVYVSPDDRRKLLQQLHQNGQITNMEINWKKKDGVVITVSLYTHTLQDNQGNIIGYEGMVFDISRRRKMEQEREQLIQELEAKNAELERFTYTVSHDLKSPLITIRAYLGLLERDVEIGNMERFRADAQRIVEATNKMQRLLGDLLELSRVGQKMNPPESIPFNAIVQEALTLTEGQRVTRGVEVNITPDLPHVLGDRLRLVEVLQNLLDNACKYMGDQPNPRISIGMLHRNSQGLFWVRDNGMGIEPQYQQKVFGLFDKLDAQSEGTGIGLALVKRIVESHGGRIWVESQGLGHGSTFFFTLPLS